MVDDASLAAGALAGHDAFVVADGGTPRCSSPRRCRPSPPSSPAAGRTSAGARGASRSPGAAGLTRRRSTATRVAGPGSRAPRSRVGDTVVLDNDDPLVVGGNVVARYGAVLSGWTLGSPAGRPAILDERVGAGRAVLFAFDPGLPRVDRERRAAAHDCAARHSRCSTIRRESQIGSSSITSSGTCRWPAERLDLVAVAPAPAPRAPPRSRSRGGAARARRGRTGTASRSGCGSGAGWRLMGAKRPQRSRRACAQAEAGGAQGERLAGAGRAGASGSRSRYQAIVASRVSSWWARAPAELAPGLGGPEGPPQRRGADLDRRSSPAGPGPARPRAPARARPPAAA